MLARGGKFNSGPGLSAPAGTNSGSELELRSFTTQHAPPAGFRAAGAGRGGSDTQATPWAFSLSFPSWSRSRALVCILRGQPGLLPTATHCLPLDLVCTPALCASHYRFLSRPSSLDISQEVCSSAQYSRVCISCNCLFRILQFGHLQDFTSREAFEGEG